MAVRKFICNACNWEGNLSRDFGEQAGGPGSQGSECSHGHVLKMKMEGFPKIYPKWKQGH